MNQRVKITVEAIGYDKERQLPVVRLRFDGLPTGVAVTQSVVGDTITLHAGPFPGGHNGTPKES